MPVSKFALVCGIASVVSAVFAGVTHSLAGGIAAVSFAAAGALDLLERWLTARR